MATGNSAGAHDRGAGGTQWTHKAGSYAVPVTPRAPIQVREIACPACGAGEQQPCVILGTGPGVKERVGEPMSGYHPARRRMATRARNERIEAGEEEVRREPSKVAVTVQKDRGHGMVVCDWCGKVVPLRMDGSLTRHSTMGGKVTRSNVPCRGASGAQVR